MKALLNALCFIFMAPVFAAPCGLQGTIEERIKECSKASGNFALVARGEDGNEIYKDTKSGLIWGPRVNFEVNHFGSQKACTSENPEAKLLKDLKWRLPTIKEFEQAATNGIKTSLPNMNHWYWTSTPVKTKTKRGRRRSVMTGAFMWDSVEETSGTGTLVDVGSIRCVVH